MAWLRAYLSVPFKALAMVLAQFVRIFRFNRAWLEARLARKSAAMAVRGILITTVLAWFLIWMFAGDEFRDNLNQALKSMWSELGN